MCLLETFLDSSYPSNDQDLLIDNYTIVRADHPLDLRRGGVCIYYKSCLPIRIHNVSNLDESLLFELSYDDKELFFVTLYRSPSQTMDEFDLFLEKFENDLQNLLNKNPFLITVLGDFNAKSSNWCSSDTTNYEGTQIDSLTSFFGLHQLISEPTHFLTHSNSCIDLIFTSQPNLVTHSGSYASLHKNCHHNIVFVKYNLEIEYPPPYERLIWHYGKANLDMIKKAALQFNWEYAFRNMNVEQKISFFNETILNIFSNFCPSKKLVFNDTDPPWLTDEIKNMMIAKDNAFLRFQKSSKSDNEIKNFQNIIQQLNDCIDESKKKY